MVAISLLSLLPPRGWAAERLVLLELFTNDTCPFCVSLTPPLERLLADYGGRVAPIFYHVNWPNSGDPFYAVAGIHVEGRLRFYGTELIPHLLVDGVPVARHLAFDSDDLDSLRSLIDQRLAQPSPLQITFQTQTRPGLSGIDTTTVDASFTVDGEVASTDLAWQVAVVEFAVEGSDPLGGGEATRYGHVLRRTAPETTLQPLALSGGQGSGSVTFITDPAWNPQRMGLVVFVQDTLSREVLQAATDLPRFDFQMPRQIQHSSTQNQLSFDIRLANRGSEPAMYDVFTTVTDTVPVTTDLSAPSASFRGDTLMIKVNPGEVGEVTLTSTLFGSPAEGRFFTHARQTAHPGIEWIRPTKVLAGYRYLYVDDNGTATIDTFYTKAFDEVRPEIGDGNELLVGTWETTLGQLTTDDLGGIDHLFWSTGTRFPGLSPADLQVLRSFVEGGGSLFVSGQDIGWELADSTSLFFSEDSKQFYNEILHAEYLGDNSNDFELRGVPGDPIGNNLVLRISGGNGANNQTSPDLIAPREPALAVFEYDTSMVGALRVDTRTYRLVYFAFGFEAIDTRQTRTLLMLRLVEWLRSPPTWVADRDYRKPLGFELLGNAPNPFNPETRIVFRIPEEGQVRVRVVDLLGRRVAALAGREFSAGRHTVLFRAQGFPSGIYVAEVSYGQQVQRHKMMLVR